MTDAGRSTASICDARLEHVHGRQRTAHFWRCALEIGHRGMHCTIGDSEWTATQPSDAASKPQP